MSEKKIATLPVTALRFRQARGPVETCTDLDFEIHQNLAAAELFRPSGGLARTARRRVTTIALVAYAVALYAVAQTVRAVDGYPYGLECRLHRLAGGPLTRAENVLRREGDEAFRMRVEQLGMSATGAVDRMADRLARI